MSHLRGAIRVGPPAGPEAKSLPCRGACLATSGRLRALFPGHETGRVGDHKDSGLDSGRALCPLGPGPGPFGPGPGTGLKIRLGRHSPKGPAPRALGLLRGLSGFGDSVISNTPQMSPILVSSNTTQTSPICCRQQHAMDEPDLCRQQHAMVDESETPSRLQSTRDAQGLDAAALPQRPQGGPLVPPRPRRGSIPSFVRGSAIGSA